MAAEILVLVSLHTFKFSCHNLRPKCLIDVFYCHVPSATTELSSPWIIWSLTMAHFSNSLLVELDKVLGINASHHVENAIKIFPYNLYQISNVYTLKSSFQGSYFVGRD